MSWMAILGGLIGWLTIRACEQLKPKTAGALGLVVGLLWSICCVVVAK